MYGAILTPPVTEHADYGVLFLHNEGYSTMCGHGIIALTTVLIETGMHPVDGEQAKIGYDSPAGFIAARADIAAGRVTRVAFTNVPSFVFHSGVEIEMRRDAMTVPVVFGGAFYALAQAADAGLSIGNSRVSELIDYGMDVKHAVEARLEVTHPWEPELRGIYGTIICDTPSEGADGRNVTVFADGEVDRSPCGTGTAARVAWLHANGRLPVGVAYIHESITGTRFSGRVLETTTVAEIPAVVPEIAGSGFITGFHTFVVEPDDPLGSGFLVR
jgi:trans-L-3-hydroxyproline dehydratase